MSKLMLISENPNQTSENHRWCQNHLDMSTYDKIYRVKILAAYEATIRRKTRSIYTQTY